MTTSATGIPTPQQPSDQGPGAQPLAACLAEFNTLFGAHSSPTPTLAVPATVTALRARLVTEEHTELREAIEIGDLAEIAKEDADLAYVLQGTADAYGLHLDAAASKDHSRRTPRADAATRTVRAHAYLDQAHLDDFLRALADQNLQAITATLTALLQAAYDVAATIGFDLDAAINAVHASNLTKVGPDGRVAHDAGGKVLKPATYRPADMTPVIAAIA